MPPRATSPASLAVPCPVRAVRYYDLKCEEHSIRGQKTHQQWPDDDTLATGLKLHSKRVKIETTLETSVDENYKRVKIKTTLETSVLTFATHHSHSFSLFNQSL